MILDFRIENLGELLDVYVPPDERMSPRKLSELIANAIESAVHFVIPEIKAMSEGESSHFQSFAEINALFKRERNKADGEKVVQKLKGLVPDDVFRIIKRSIKETPAKFPPPQIVQGHTSSIMFTCVQENVSDFHIFQFLYRFRK